MTRNTIFKVLPKQMHVRDVARIEERNDNLCWANRQGGMEVLYALCEDKYQVVGVGSYDACIAVKASYPNATRMEDLDELAAQMDIDEREQSLYLGPREEGVTWAAC